MTRVNYAALAVYAGDYLDFPLPNPIEIGRGQSVPELTTAVYVAVGMDGTVLYVGSVARPTNARGVGTRLSEHLAIYDRFQTWNQLYVLPLHSNTPIEAVRSIEGRVGAHLGPTKSRALPRLGRRKRS